jgi:hypothetical protein
MTVAKCSDADFMRLFDQHGAGGTARKLGVAVRNVFARRERLETKYGRQIRSENSTTRVGVTHPQRAPLEIENGQVIVASDGHYWTGAPSTAHRALIKFCKDLKPKAVIMNGDSLDGATISRHPPINWEARPSLIDELDAVKERHREIERAVSPKTLLVWNLGNHDARFETRLATVAPEYARVHGFHLKDHFPRWGAAWSTWINSDVVVKHRWKGGVHATHNNTAGSGKSMVTGHLHSAKVTPYTDYTGTRYGVDTGCLADPSGPQFEYTEDNPKNWRSGFCVLTFHKGKLLQPQLVIVHDSSHVDYCGGLIRV